MLIRTLARDLWSFFKDIGARTLKCHTLKVSLIILVKYDLSLWSDTPSYQSRTGRKMWQIGEGNCFYRFPSQDQEISINHNAVDW